MKIFFLLTRNIENYKINIDIKSNQFKEKIIEVEISLSLNPIKDNFEKIKSGKVQFFSHTWLDLGADFNWITNPETNFKYDIAKHWSEIESLSKESGDIKYVWEKARFSYVYHVIRYDFHY